MGHVSSIFISYIFVLKFFIEYFIFVIKSNKGNVHDKHNIPEQTDRHT